MSDNRWPVPSSEFAAEQGSPRGRTPDLVAGAGHAEVPDPAGWLGA